MPHLHDLTPQLAANRRYWAGWAGDDPDSDLAIYRTELAYAMLNGVLRVRGLPLDEAVGRAREQLKGLPWVWWVGADSDEGSAEGLLGHGAEQIGEMPIMARELTTLPAAALPDGVRIRPVVEQDEMQAYVDAYAGPLRLDRSGLHRRVESELKSTNIDLVRLAAVAGGRTIGTATLSLATEVAALYAVTTRPAYRRQGIGAALTGEVLRVARDAGRQIATLQATAEGEPLYRRLGFTTVGRYRLFRLAQSGRQLPGQ